jgi:anion transporter
MSLEGLAMTKYDATIAPIAMAPSNAPKPQDLMTPRQLIGALLGPIIGLVLWWLPLDLPPAAHKAVAIASFMLVYWVTEPIEYGLTALLGCYLFWALQVTPFAVAFSGFTTSTPWFVFGALLMGEAASRTGLARRLGYLVMQRIGTSYSRVLLGLITLTWLLNVLIPSPNALLATLAPLAMGILAVFGMERHTNMAKGLFVVLTYGCSLFGKMILGGGATVLTRGMIEEQTGIEVLWSQWFVAYLPAALLTIVAAWLTIRWLYPAEHDELPGGQRVLHEALNALGPWSHNEKKALVWLLLAIALWATDFVHHVNPAVIAIGIGLLLTFPKLGLLDAKAMKKVNFLVIIFLGGALSMGNVLMQTSALKVLTDNLVARMVPLLSDGFHAAILLYWGNFFYHFLMGNELTVISTSLPVLLSVAHVQGYSPAVVGMIWAFAGGAKLFVYQSSVLVVGYSYGYFDSKDLLKVGAVLTIVEAIFLMILVPVYWPLIGLHWMVP